MEPTLLSGAQDEATVPRVPPRLRDIPLLAAAPAEALEALAETAEPLALRAGEWLFEAGEPGDALYVVTSGRFRVVGGEDATTTIRVVGPGALLGELAVLTRSERSASVQAVRDSQVIALDADRFSALVERDAAFAAALARTLARQLQQSGGLLPPPATAAVYTVVASPGDVVDAFVDELVEQFEALGPTETFAPATSESPAAARAALAAAEGRARYVLLVTRATDTQRWREFALRQSDRTLVVTDGGGGAHIEGADVVFVGNTPPGTIAARLDELRPRAHHVVPSADGDAVGRVARRLAGRSLGIVLSGGGARGFAHIGAIQALRAAGFEPDRIGGCSIGSFIGAMTAVGLEIDEIVDICERELVRRSPFSDYTLPRVSLIRARRASAMLQRVFGGTVIEELERPLFTVSADLIASALVVHRRGPIWQGVGASMSIPGLAPPVTVGSQLLVDGGVLNNLPVDLMDADEGPVVAVDVIKRMDAPSGDGVASLPSITETLSRATVLGSVERSERNRGLATLTIVPDVQDVGLRQFRQLRHAVEAGRLAAEETLERGGADVLHRALGTSPAEGG